MYAETNWMCPGFESHPPRQSEIEQGDFGFDVRDDAHGSTLRLGGLRSAGTDRGQRVFDGRVGGANPEAGKLGNTYLIIG